MEIKNIQRKVLNEEDKKVPITIRVQRTISDWMKFRNVSPTALFETSALELMNKDKEWIAKQKSSTTNKIE